MTNNEFTANKTKFAIASVALAFCLVWALIGESNIKIIAVAISFICFLKAGIETEMSARALHGGH